MNQKLILIVAMLLLASSVYAAELSISVPPRYQTLRAGEELNFQVTIKEKDVAGRHDVDFIYEIQDPSNNILASSKETKAIETQASFVSSLYLPISAQDGQHTVIVRVNQTSASSSFYVVGEEEDPIGNYLLITGLVILLVFLLILWEVDMIRKKWKQICKIPV